MVMGRTSPTVRRRRLAAVMRKLRAEHQVNLDEVAKGSNVPRTTVYRIENATHAPKVNDVRALCLFYGLADKDAEQLMTLARESRLRGWWQKPHSSIPTWFETYVGLEEEASEILIYEHELITGLAQTEDYFRALLRVDPLLPGESEQEKDRRVEVRTKRQERLTGPDAPRLWIILNETAVRRAVGGHAVMKDQLERLIELCEPRNVTLQILPFSAGAHAAVDGSFHILSFPARRDPSIVYLQFRRGSIYLEEAADLREYTEIYDHLRATALSPESSVEVIRQVIDQGGGMRGPNP
ncbi:helix-turn-helix transcriptional regulator [Actinocorallia sp. A-T 12471]|uniref:helix-turn-helix domain-containing protein n=1 Tax=Actinocorallia sp. A-T 12471 TaxID=3089813 RepID=UPI0029CAF3D3|nr:helix-turn-helix transcriptional regulator [Actinocorallia sp. A-T 12471]MDX6742487.1 helix-turn-helix transcriptional regulator [Actinocorallia sp. A-T 12471]